MYATLNDSYHWQRLNSNGAMIQKIQDILAKGEIITPDRIPSAMLQFKNRIKSPLTSNILKRMEYNQIVLIYAPTVKIPVYLPFIISKSENKIKGIVFINSMVESESNKSEERDISSTGEIFLNARKLKVALESCYISLALKEMGNSPKTRSTTILKSGSRIYSSIFTECINRKHAIKLDENVYNSLTYITARYFISTVIGCKDNMDPETMRNYCLYNCKNADILSMDRIISQFTNEDFANIASLIEKMKLIPEFSKRLGDLTVSNFIESYINMYNASMILALEVFDYFIYNIISVIDTTYINNYPMLKNIVGDDGKKIYADLVVATSNL